MLTIENFHKKMLAKSPTKNDWWVCSTKETQTQYHIYIQNKDKAFNRINIERMPMGGGGEHEYELWWWDNEPDPAKQKPIRYWLSIYDLRMGHGPLVELIDYMLKNK